MGKFLNKNTRFKCSFGSTPCTAYMDIPTAASCNGSNLLTSAASFLPPAFGTCMAVPSNPKPCTVARVLWLQTANVMSGGKNILTDKSKAPCTATPGGLIKPFLGASFNVGNNCKVNIPPIGSINASGSSGGEKNFQKHFMDNNIEKPSELKTSVDHENIQQMEPASPNVGDPAENINGSAADKPEELPKDLMCLCGGDPSKCPDEYRSKCTYKKIQKPLLSSDDSSTLGTNICEVCPDRDHPKSILCKRCLKLDSTAYRKTEIDADGRCFKTKPAYHHIVSRSVYEKRPEFARLASFLGYNINRASNGICLPMPNEPKKLTANLTDNEKCILWLGYDRRIMWSCKKQVHRTNHEYRLNGDCFLINGQINELKKIPECADDPLMSDALRFDPLKASSGSSVAADAGGTGYMYYLLLEIDDIIDALRNKYQGCCYMQEKENLQADFDKMIGYVEDKIRNKLMRFDQCPLYSAPFFLSRNVVNYAYEHTLKLKKGRK